MFARSKARVARVAWCATRALLVFADALLAPCALFVSWLVPAPVHRGHRARRLLARVPAMRPHATARFSRQLLLSHWRSSLRRHLVSRLPEARLHAYLDTLVRIEGEVVLQDESGERRPIVIVTHDCGLAFVGCVALARRLRDQRLLGVATAPELPIERARALGRRAGVAIEFLCGQWAGARRAAGWLRREGCLAITPELFDDPRDVVAVPFLGRWLGAAAAPAAIALRGDALVIPVHVVACARLGVCIRIQPPIETRRFRDPDERQAVFALSCALFARLGAELIARPEHWRQWDLLRQTAPLDLPKSAAMEDLELALARRCQAFPALLLRVPQLGAALCGPARSTPSSTTGARETSRATGGISRKPLRRRAQQVERQRGVPP